jgi:short-subunit dehydrogenase
MSSAGGKADLTQQKLYLKGITTANIEVSTIAKDLASPKAAEEIFTEVQKLGKHIDILVNNAGFNESGPFCQTDAAKELEMLQVHVVSLTHLTKLFLAGMRQKGDGKVLNVGSTGSFAPCPLDAVYCATKAYVLSFSSAIRAELAGTGVSVSTLCPGATNTEFAKKANMENTMLFKRFVMDPEDVAHYAYRKFMKNKKIIIPGLFNRLLVLSIPVSPSLILDKVSAALLQRA